MASTKFIVKIKWAAFSKFVKQFFPFHHWSDSLQVVFKQNQVNQKINQKHQRTTKANHDMMHRETKISAHISLSSFLYEIDILK